MKEALYNYAMPNKYIVFTQCNVVPSSSVMVASAALSTPSITPSALSGSVSTAVKISVSS